MKDETPIKETIHKILINPEIPVRMPVRTEAEATVQPVLKEIVQTGTTRETHPAIREGAYRSHRHTLSDGSNGNRH